MDQVDSVLPADGWRPARRGKDSVVKRMNQDSVGSIRRLQGLGHRRQEQERWDLCSPVLLSAAPAFWFSCLQNLCNLWIFVLKDRVLAAWSLNSLLANQDRCCQG